jgi:hypothetical protein
VGRGPLHVKSTFTVENPQPPGAFCDFSYGEVATVSLDAIIFAGTRIGEPGAARSPARQARPGATVTGENGETPPVWGRT